MTLYLLCINTKSQFTPLYDRIDFPILFLPSSNSTSINVPANKTKNVTPIATISISAFWYIPKNNDRIMTNVRNTFQRPCKIPKILKAKCTASQAIPKSIHTGINNIFPNILSTNIGSSLLCRQIWHIMMHLSSIIAADRSRRVKEYCQHIFLDIPDLSCILIEAFNRVFHM